MTKEPLVKDEWQPIETAPKDGTRFLAIAKDGVVGIVSRHDPGGEARNKKHHYECWVTDFNSHRGLPPVFWMPLPDPPDGAQGRKRDDVMEKAAAEIERLRAVLKNGWSTLALFNVKNYHPALVTLQAQLLAGLEQSDEATKEEA